MTTTLTPPPPVAPGPPPRRPSTAGTVIAIVAIVVGALVIGGTALSAFVSTASALGTRSETKTLALGGENVTGIDIDLSAGSLEIAFSPTIEDVRLEVTGSAGATGWTLRQEGQVIRVASPQHSFVPGWWFGGPGRAVLQLPADYVADPLDAQLRISAGDLTAASGRFGTLSLDAGAGKAVISGTAREVHADLSAGAADLDLANVQTADLSVSAGAMTTRFTGTPPTIAADVSAGSLVMSVPQAPYDVRSSVTAGSFENHLGTTPGAGQAITVQVSAGQAVLRAG